MPPLVLMHVCIEWKYCQHTQMQTTEPVNMEEQQYRDDDPAEPTRAPLFVGSTIKQHWLSAFNNKPYHDAPPRSFALKVLSLVLLPTSSTSTRQLSTTGLAEFSSIGFCAGVVGGWWWW